MLVQLLDPGGQLDRDQSRQLDPGLVQLLAGGTRPGPIKSLFCNRVGQGLGAFDSDRPLSCIPDLQRRRASSHFDPGCENALDGTLIRFALGDRMGCFVSGADRSQTTLFPECLGDWIDEE